MRIENLITAGMTALKAAKEQHIEVCITVIDSGAHVVYQIRMDDANFMTNEISYLKAKTAFLFKCPSHMLRTITEKVPILAHAIQQVPGDACMLEGGLPIKAGDRYIGGIGVSGGNFDQDLLIATTFLQSLEKTIQEN
ncbi:hypothetical protein CJD36_017455 [Flavipsychrobacter stenotrophus]|uniref:Heme-binding protein n=1 Tax=Flavipsychrobacter stenotrophus TaxID=2077091 RepID=A0A2S7ST64_9BACT|nr:heme-binding protein [Flavipsychrobacter stenotrophus]PQJ09716.1 hypothetical protein CJD36_017455 [Flavipsychrobacter stenotrophus]